MSRRVGATRLDAARDALAQTEAAEDALFQESTDFLHFPWRDVDEIVGGIGGGNVWFVGGFSGNGKTTFLMNFTARLLEANRTVYYLGTETQPNELRTKLACLRTGVYAGDVLSGASSDWKHWSATRESLIGDIRAQRALRDGNRFLVCPVARVDASDLTGAFHDAAVQNAHVIVIDHIDHIVHGQGKNGFEDARLLAHLVLDLAQTTGLPTIVATQFNNEALKGNRLGQYLPPQPNHVFMGGTKRQIAWGMLGLYRPLRDDITAADMKAARSGQSEPSKFLEPDTLGVVVMKHRHYGAREGQRARLSFDHGRLLDVPERDKYVTDPLAKGPRP